MVTYHLRLVTRHRQALLRLCALTLLVSACAAQPSATTQPSTAAVVSSSAFPSTSAGPVLSDVAPPDFYAPTPDAVARAAPGKIVASLEIKAPTGMRAWFVVYASTGLDDAPVAVSGMILAPEEPPTAGGYPVVAWAHGTTGIADECAPSKQGVVQGISSEIRSLVAEGHVVTASDYEGLGTDGIHPYLVGNSEGRSVLDSIRAAQALQEAHAGAQAVVIGHSQGGHAALWAAELAPTYAPDLEIVGALATSPPVDLRAWETWAFESAAAGNLVAAAGPVLLFGVWNDVYDLPFDFLTDEGQQSAVIGRESCYPGMIGATPYLADPVWIPDWSQRLRENSPGATRTRIPILVVTADTDFLVQRESQLSGIAGMCAAGDTVELRTVHGDHGAPWSASNWPAALAWVTDRFAGADPLSTCSVVP